jgi:GNAT superfamily N-acetyltransferase
MEKDLGKILTDIRNKFPGVKIYAFDMPEQIYISSINVPEEMRGKGIGTLIIEKIKDFAKLRGKPVTLRPQAERGHKEKLDNFYKRLGFVDNKGRNKDYKLSSPFGRTMYWKFKEWLES